MPTPNSVTVNPSNPKHLTYEVFGPPGTVANISFFNIDADPQHIEEASLHGRAQFAITATSAMGRCSGTGRY